MRKNKLLEIYNDKGINQAGTDFPCYYDEKNDVEYSASWNVDYAFPFGYWPIDDYGTTEFCVAKPYLTHANACGIAAKEFFENKIQGAIKENIDELSDHLDELIFELKHYNYRYNEDEDIYVSADGTDEFSVDDKACDISDIISNCVSYNLIPISSIEDAISYVIENGTHPDYQEIEEAIWDELNESYSFGDKESIENALEFIGYDFQWFFEQGYGEGRIFVNKEIISFYPTEQPDPNELMATLKNLSENDEIGVDYDDLLNYIIIFENPYINWTVTACTVSDYIDGNYNQGDEDDDEDEDEDFQYAKDGKTTFVPHLASPEEKRKYFQDFRNTRDKAIYVPQERAAGSVAAYHAMRYPYGEIRKRIGDIIKEEIEKLLK